MNKTAWFVVIVIIIIGGWYLLWGGSSSPSPATQPVATSTEATAPQPATPLLSVASSTELGAYLVASNGMTLYTFKNDKPNVSNCSGACATLWPPYLVSATSSMTVASDVTGQVGTTTRADGTIQATYNSMPLYFYQSDAAPGDTTGQGVKNLWLVVKP